MGEEPLRVEMSKGADSAAELMRAVARLALGEDE